MARTKQTGPEVKLYQIDTMVYLGTKNIITKLSMFIEFLNEGGVIVADNIGLNRARALERYDKNYKIKDIYDLLSVDGQANETWLRKNGLLNSINGKYELSQIANAIYERKISLAEYCFLLLSKQWIKVKEVGGQDEYKQNTLALILEDFLNAGKISTDTFVSHFGNKVLETYKDQYIGLSLSNQEASRFLIEPLLITGLIEESNGYYILAKKYTNLAKDYVQNSNLIRRVDEVSCPEEEYWNSFQYGFYDLINDSNEDIYSSLYSHLFDMKCAYEKKGNLPLLQITYGAPGTGKSFGLDEDVKKYGMKDIRTTFHPDSDYSTFVGAYKPQMEKVIVRDDRGFPVKENGQIVFEKKIVYKYTQQAFLKAYVAAWKDIENPHVLVIEEINRGNCAQIFGDLFQLLDRNDLGFSKYPITADTDIMQELNNEFEGLKIANSEAINSQYKDDVVSDVISGSRLLLPNNLYIWATMNTSDQSLFPIDSAFKRRWEWKYIPISDAKKHWRITVNGVEYDWWSFVENINNKIWDATHSEDKKLGYFFCKADRKLNENDDENSIISADRFVGKVLFYIYNDVFKDYGFDDSIFKDKDDGNKDLLFQSYFKADGRPDESKIEVFLKNLEVKLASEIEHKEDIGDEHAEEEQTAEGQLAATTTFKVVLDGETIEEAEQFDTYLESLKKMGMDKVEEIAAEKEYNRYDCPFVSKEQFDAIKEKDNFSYVEADGYQVIKGINKRGMSNFLKLCADKLGHNITIE